MTKIFWEKTLQVYAKTTTASPVTVKKEAEENFEARENLYNQVRSLVSDPHKKVEVSELVDRILHYSDQFRGVLKLRNANHEKLWQDYSRQRGECWTQIESLDDSNWSSLFEMLRDLKELSNCVLRLTRIAQGDLQELKQYRQGIVSNLKILIQKIGGDEFEIKVPWRLRYAGEVDPLGSEPLTLSLEDDGELKPQQNGKKDPTTEYCDTCGWEIGFSAERWRCIACRQVQCDRCHKHFSKSFHGACLKHKLGIVQEHMHPTTMVSHHLGFCNNLSETLLSIMNTWKHRPCFRRHDRGDWLTYGDVMDRALRLVSMLKFQTSCPGAVVLCFPAGSMEFYLWDIACILTGVTTIGMPVPPSPIEDWPTLASHVVCSSEIRQEYGDHMPSNLIWLNEKESSEEPYDVNLLPTETPDAEDAVYTVYMTSGSTGRPKAMAQTRKRFLKDHFAVKILDRDITPSCTVSYDPACWAGDRSLVYGCLRAGYRIGFSPPNPTLPQIVETMERNRPTFLSLQPVVVQYLCSFPEDKRPTLGGQVEHISVGSAPTSTQMMNDLKEMFGVPEVVEGYGTTEVGNIAVNGRIRESLRRKISIRDPNRDGVCLNEQEEGVTGELWIGGINTSDIVELTDEGRKVKVIGRSCNAQTFKLKNGKWCPLVDIESEITRACCPDMFDEVMVWCNSQGVLVLLGVITSNPIEAQRETLLLEVHRKTNLPTGMQPQALLVTDKPFPKTITMKIQRGKVISKFQEAADRLQPTSEKQLGVGEQEVATALDAAEIAALVLGKQVDKSKSFLENGGDSLSAVQWLHEMKKRQGEEVAAKWRSLLDDPLDGRVNDMLVDGETQTFAPAAIAHPSAKHVLLTGATGFFGRHVLSHLLKEDNATIVVCLVREPSRMKVQETSRAMVVTSVPQQLEYRSVIHLAANVNHVLPYSALKADNVDMTADLLSLRLAPMIYCSTSSTKEGTAPFPDGYTQSKWVSEQMVQRSGGTCFWPPLLLWANHRDWLTRLVQHCLQVGTFPSSLGYVVACDVEVAARDLLAGRPCAAYDLDLSELFGRMRMEASFLQPVSMESFIAGLRRDKNSPAYPVLPLFQGKGRIGNPRSPSLELFQIDWDRVWPFLSEEDM